jgi:uncharacterized protein YlxP (DUF503 family)
MYFKTFHHLGIRKKNHLVLLAAIKNLKKKRVIVREITLLLWNFNNLAAI